MLPDRHRLHSSVDFTRTVKHGRRAGRRDVVIHAFGRDDASTVESPSGARFGLVISKAVGPAVTRHRVARRLRHICSRSLPAISPCTDVVLRALPGAADASSAELERQVMSCLRKLGATVGRTDTGVEDAS